MLLSTFSTLNRIFGTRHGCNREAAAGTIFGTGPTWLNYNYHPCFEGRLYLSGSQEYGLYFPKIGEYFEYTDKIAGIGYAHVIRAEFTAEETLLCRAEAYVHLNNFSAAVADLKTYDDSRKIENYYFYDLSEELIRLFYIPSNTLFVNQFNTASVAPDFTVTESQKPLLDCVLHFRRIETIFDGLRWFDIKRYGIEITHKIGRTGVDKLVATDERRAIQLPAEVIAAGLSPNIRTKSANLSTIVKLDIKPSK